MVDAGGSDAFWPHGYKWAWNTAKMLAEYDVTWFEEPLRPDDLEGYIRLTENAPVPIAAARCLLAVNRSCPGSSAARSITFNPT